MAAKNGFQLQKQDIELLDYVFQLRLATIDHLAELSGRSVRALWGRLPKLTERRYLTTIARHMQKNVYGVGSAGAAALAEYGYAPDEITGRRLRDNERSEIGIRHSLFVADIHTRIFVLSRGSPLSLADWREGPALWDSVTPEGAETSVPIRPDAYFVHQNRTATDFGDKFHIFLEADRSTMAHTRMAAKITGYLAYYEQGLHARKYPGMRSFIVATVTETRRRAEELRRDLHPLIPRAARPAYRFIACEDLSLASLVRRRD